jgi:hypothetical protein
VDVRLHAVGDPFLRRSPARSRDAVRSARLLQPPGWLRHRTRRDRARGAAHPPLAGRGRDRHRVAVVTRAVLDFTSSRALTTSARRAIPRG